MKIQQDVAGKGYQDNCTTRQIKLMIFLGGVWRHKQYEIWREISQLRHYTRQNNLKNHCISL